MKTLFSVLVITISLAAFSTQVFAKGAATTGPGRPCDYIGGDKNCGTDGKTTK